LDMESNFRIQDHEGSSICGLSIDKMDLCVSIIIPTLNEAEGIRETIRRIPVHELKAMGYDIEIIVVDGGSKDGTDKIAKELGALVVYELRRGYGRAYKKGFSVAKCSIIVTLDGDASYPPEIIPELLRLMKDLDVDFITTSRIPQTGAMSFINKVGNYILTLVTRILFRIDIRDSQSGMWVIKKEILEDILPRSEGMEFSEEIKIKAFLCGKKVYEHPIQYYKRAGKPKLRRVRDGLRNLVYLFIIYIHSRMGRRCYK